ncbi:MAG: hypothetical protein IKL27_03605 [Oscillospiraceae bacterium]|nr:hypothetical protein [Oscillospiraceae bacterium]
MDARYNDELYFGSRPIFGSAAPQIELPEPEVLERPQEKVSIRTKTKTAAKQGISLFAVAGWASVIVLAVALLMSYVELNTIANESYELREELENLQIEETKLQIAYESTFRLDEVEEYATNMLGMVRAGNDQVKYLSNRAEDQAVMLDTNSVETGISASLKSLFTTIAEYFK